MKRIVLTLALSLLTFGNLLSQNINLDEYEIYVGDTLIGKSDFVKNGQNLSPEKAEKLQFKPITDGNKTSYYFNGTVSTRFKDENYRFLSTFL